MDDICPKCGLPQNLCVCQEIAKEEQKIKIKTDRRRFGKVVTIVSGLESSVNPTEIMKELKRKLACGGTAKDDEIILQGEHRAKVKDFLLSKGFKEELIDA
ncbi:MAG: stress response translation initiation inhibitor YciH [Candidatus Diapherotrites archaeon]|uniref:Protein translation factor SUI1 homolog n=1 Tax=Candidatus Iainarchaeum sp. TaxID=3101447 RepID=A0A2D6M0P8_9ARCH|nr:stress response translation initiation inhibitor YciH [Candidatus Diapherotrites archaeon]|tara:strand:+ start:725 stop:1027 length:303 start_codon:yes stop_codon:yes gene_type:complete